jgi:6,7-dimethyl-8-ribityllumazine synthase
MTKKKKNLSDHSSADIPNGQDLKIGIVTAQWNRTITDQLLDGCAQALKDHGVSENDIFSIQVPGSYELPQGARILLTRHRKLDAVICLGCVIKGETDHNNYINRAVASGLMQLGLTSGVPCIFGVLTPNSMEQAVERSGGKHGNKGIEAAISALQMADLNKREGLPAHKIGFGL